MRILLANNHCISDPTTGVTHSLRTILQWLQDAGHTCRALTTARLESSVSLTIEQHLQAFGINLPIKKSAKSRVGRSPVARAAGRPELEYTVSGVPVTLLLTRHNDETRPDRAEAHQFGALFARLCQELRPDLLIACNGHPMIRRALADARAHGVTTAFAVRSFGYDDPRFFEDVDHVFTCSQFLTDYYRARVGIDSTPIEPPIEWASVLAPSDARAFVTFVNPSPHKGLYLFARLADMLGSRRPDIPLLIIQSGHSAGALNRIPDIDFSRYPQIMAAPAVPTPADYFALTRVLLVPSVWDEPFGRVAAEAMINGIPAIVSDRGSLPHVVGGDVSAGGAGCVRPIPEWMTYATTRVPDADEVEPWFEAVCRLWDDAAFYDRVARSARDAAEARYAEAASRARHVDYFTGLRPRATPVLSR